MKVFVLSKKNIIAYSYVLLLLVGLIGFNKDATVSVFENSIKKDLPIYCVKRGDDEKVCSISFDAAWGNEDTEQLIKILADYNVKATFFVVGDWAEKYPESVKALSDAGHEVMNHSDTHPHFTQISKEKMLAEVAECDSKIEKITGVKPFLFRPPYGDYNNDVVSTLREAGHYTIQWDVDSLDWKDPTPQDMTKRVLSKIQNGSIVLLHNGAKNTPEALPMIIEGILAEGYKIVPISEILLSGSYTTDHEGRMHTEATQS